MKTNNRWPTNQSFSPWVSLHTKAITLATEPRVDQARPNDFAEGTAQENPRQNFELSMANRIGLRDGRSGSLMRLPAEINHRAVLINLDELTGIDSRGIALFIEAAQRIAAQGGSLALFGIHDDLRRVFKMTLLDQVFRIFSTREEALADTGRR